MTDNTVAFIVALCWCGLLYALILVTGGCVQAPTATHEPMTAADGERAMFISCPRSRGECLSEAATVCPNGYQVLEQGERQDLRSGQSAPTFVAYDGHVIPQQGPARVWAEYHGEMLVRCSRSDD